jgi:hypothetical protein
MCSSHYSTWSLCACRHKKEMKELEEKAAAKAKEADR